MNKYLPTFVILLTAAIVYWFYPSSRPTPQPAIERPNPSKQVDAPIVKPKHEPEPLALKPKLKPQPFKAVTVDNPRDPMVLPYRIVDGLILVQGDIVAGAVPEGERPEETGRVRMEPIKLWPNVIPYHVQPDVENPERILQAIKMFDGTAVRFIKYTTEKYALVFEKGEKNCLSYMGHVVDTQPIWISPDCTPNNIAHEILHALGFAHEQNRTDRDDYIIVHDDNIEEEFKHNFTKLPQNFMIVSGLSEFDFQSVMLYAPWMFAKGGRSTMEPKLRDNLIQPKAYLSEKDILRINRAYQYHY